MNHTTSVKSILIVSATDILQGAMKTFLMPYAAPEIVTCYIGEDDQNVLAIVKSFLKRAKYPPDMLVIDEMAVEDALVLTEQLVFLYPGLRIVYVAGGNLSALKIGKLVEQIGVTAVLCMKDRMGGTLTSMLDAVYRGRVYLSESAVQAYQTYKEAQVFGRRLSDVTERILMLMLGGYSSTEIAQRLNCQRQTVYQYQHRLRDMFQVTTNQELVEKAAGYALALNGGNYVV